MQRQAACAKTKMRNIAKTSLHLVEGPSKTWDNDRKLDRSVPGPISLATNAIGFWGCEPQSSNVSTDITSSEETFPKHDAHSDARKDNLQRLHNKPCRGTRLLF